MQVSVENKTRKIESKILDWDMLTLLGDFRYFGETPFLEMSLSLNNGVIK